MHLYRTLLSVDPTTSRSTAVPYSLVQTVASQKSLLTRQQIEGADTARQLSRVTSHLLDSVLEHAVTHGHILNCPITADDVSRATTIYGPDIAFLKGYSSDKTDQAQAHVPTPHITAVPPHILEHHGAVVLCIDFFFVQGIPFLHCVTRDIGYRNTIAVPSRSKAVTVKFITKVVQSYHSCGFTVRAIHGDNEFNCAKDKFTDIVFDIVPRTDTSQKWNAQCEP